MARKSMAAIRKAELAEAAYVALSRNGIQGTTLTAVAEIAGVSKASVLHYYESKDALLEGALRQANAVLLQEATKLLRMCNTPWERIYAVIEANLSPTSFTPQVAHAWVALCSEVPHNLQYQRIQTVIYRRNWSNVYAAMRQFCDEDLAFRATQLLLTLFDGIWLRCSLHPQGVARQDALEQIDFILEIVFPNDRERISAQRNLGKISEILFAT